MTILNYFFIGFAFTFIVDLLLSIGTIKNHPKMINKSWGLFERVLAITIWPLFLSIFLIQFTKSYFKK